MKIIINGSFIEVKVKRLNKLGMVKGLMFSSKSRSRALLFEDFSFAIHSFFVFYPFLALWLDKNNGIVHKEIVKPWRFHIKPKVKFSKLVEIPINEYYKDLIKKIIQ